MEMKIYEKIGVRQWKKFVLWLMSQIIRNPVYRKGANYYLKGINIEAVKKFRKMLWLNGLIHLFGEIVLVEEIIELFPMEFDILSISILIKKIIIFFVNLYCIMLQRYNWLRIKRVLAKVARK